MCNFFVQDIHLIPSDFDKPEKKPFYDFFKSAKKQSLQPGWAWLELSILILAHFHPEM